eukprot:TRINITY_DN23286_c0_g1_i7.p1 TRINITY_DN23286_c0_g1~~TRINITY_DN23286_c0_g1_i7.p1  ORF type:complete len:101 (+),score=16.56 TRINITY_DN23286_c0_g1_i7:230-532(+)
MASGDDKSTDFYAVLGLKKECSATELRNAYKKLALVRNTVIRDFNFFHPCFLTSSVILGRVGLCQFENSGKKNAFGLFLDVYIFNWICGLFCLSLRENLD